MAAAFQIKDIRRQGNRVEADFLFGDRSHQVFFETDDFALAPRREAALALCLYAGMHTGSDLEVNGEISPKMLAALPRVQDYYHYWNSSFQHITLRNVQPRAPQPGSRKRVALFFSGGMDCWYSLLKSKDEITDLVYVWGMDISLDNRELYERAVANIRQVADAFGKHLVVIRSNLREFTETYVPYNKMYGTMLAGIAQLLAEEVGKVYIAGGQWYTVLMPSGSQVLIDESWSTESLQIIYDGLELSRLGKAHLVGQNDLAMRTLRVCWANPHNDYNCGRCEKCLRTMVNLEIAGALERCTTFAVPLSLKRLSKVTFFCQNDLIFLEENTQAAKQQPHNRKLFRALRRSLNRFYLIDFGRKVLANYRAVLPNRKWLKAKLRRMSHL